MRNGSAVIRWSDTHSDSNDSLAISSTACRSRTKVRWSNCSIPRVPLGGLYPKCTRRPGTTSSYRAQGSGGVENAGEGLHVGWIAVLCAQRPVLGAPEQIRIQRE